jgi:hypothetical protein
VREFKPTPDRITELLVPRVREGARIEPMPTLAHSREGFAKLDPWFKVLERPEVSRRAVQYERW